MSSQSTDPKSIFPDPTLAPMDLPKPELDERIKKYLATEEIFPDPNPIAVLPMHPKRSEKRKERLRALERVAARVPPRLARKIEWYAMKFSQTLGYKITTEEVINIALAQFTKSEHYLDEYYTKRRLIPPKFVKRKIRVRKDTIGKIIDKFAGVLDE